MSSRLSALSPSSKQRRCMAIAISGVMCLAIALMRGTGGYLVRNVAYGPHERHRVRPLCAALPWRAHSRRALDPRRGVGCRGQRWSCILLSIFFRAWNPRRVGRVSAGRRTCGKRMASTARRRPTGSALDASERQ